MLQLKKIKKSYKTGDFVQHALKGISLDFRENEFTAILGQSGSGKTTLLNIIGGLDRYDEGDLIINGKSTKDFKDRDWDAYRNNSVGFIFQSYNLITHISVLSNVEMCMTLSGVSSTEKRKRALEVLDRVGLKEHAHKKPNQLSGGQMQRVAIARALVNNPDIILADEPTGALDTTTSVQIMELIKEIAKDKLVVMVTHNPELAEQYASRIIKVKDGEIESDSNPIDKEEEKSSSYSLKKTAMGFLSALNLSFNNIWTKKGRTFLTAFASSIGIIGISIILALSNGFDKEISNFQSDTLSNFPIMIMAQSQNMDISAFSEMHTSNKEFDNNKLYPSDPLEDTIMHTNKITDDYVSFVESIDTKYISGITYTRAVGMNFVNKVDDKVSMMKSSYFTEVPISKDVNTNSWVEQNYDLLTGKYPTSKEELILVVESDNKVDKSLLKIFGIDEEKDTINFDEIIGKEIKLVSNDIYYKSLGDYFTVNTDLEAMYQNNNTTTLKIVGIVKPGENISSFSGGSGLGYTSYLVDYVLEQNKNSEIVVKQQDSNYNILTGEKFDLATEEGNKAKDNMLKYFGGITTPVAINVFPVDFASKEAIVEKLDEFNVGKEEEDQVIYTDLAETVTSLSGSIMDAITIVLVAFSSISLVVSTIMIAIITYISVLERTKEIGILRAMGARKKDITRVFNAETFIIGLCSALLGLGISYLLLFPINSLLENLTNLANVAKMDPMNSLILVAISVILTLIGGWIPAKIAAKKDPVNALRSE